MDKEIIKLKCKKCNSKTVYTLKDGTVVCKTRGFRDKNNIGERRKE